jgi:hypothetical protein
MEEEQKHNPTPVSGSAAARSGDSLPRRMRLSIEGAWKEASQLAETILDTLLLPPGGFSALVLGWLTTALFFSISLAFGVVIGIGALFLFLGFECLALLAYAYPGALFLVSVAGGIAPPLILYWLLHSLFAIDGSWTTWGPYPAVLVGLFGSYYYWRVARVITSSGAGVLAFYRRAAPTASEIFGAPFAIFSAVWNALKLLLGALRSVAGELSAFWSRYREDSHEQDVTKVHPTSAPKAAAKTDDERGADE